MLLNSFCAQAAPRSRVHALLASVTIIMAVAATSMAAVAQVIVVQSTAKNLKSGTAISNTETVNIPAGKQAVFVLPSGATRTVTGPFNGKAAELTKGVKANPGVFDAVKQYVVTGGASKKTVGAMRSAMPTPTAMSGGLPFSWRTVPVTTSGDHCIEKNADIQLVRQHTGREQTVTIVDMKSQRRVAVVFAAGAKSAPWPDDLEVDPKATYAVLMKDWPVRKLRMRLITPLPAREDTLQVLHGQRCASQFRAFIREMQQAG